MDHRTADLFHPNPKIFNKVISIDLPGHGRSSIPVDTYELNDMSMDVIKLTEKLNLNKFYLVGHSMGGLITLSICEKFPEKIITYLVSTEKNKMFDCFKKFSKDCQKLL